MPDLNLDPGEIHTLEITVDTSKYRNTVKLVGDVLKVVLHDKDSPAKQRRKAVELIEKESEMKVIWKSSQTARRKRVLISE